MYADSDRGQVRWRSRTLIRNGSNQSQPILTEARFFASNESRLVPEVCVQLGSFYIQAEYYMAWAANTRTMANPNVDLGTFFGKSYYVQAMYFLTGEHNPYNKQLGRWERIIPHSNFFWMNGGCRRIFSSGCWLTGVRYSYIDLRDFAGVNGAAVTPLGSTPSSAGVYNLDWSTNWILNPNARIMFDVTYGVRTTANTPGSNGPYGGCGMRMQIDF